MSKKKLNDEIKNFKEKDEKRFEDILKSKEAQKTPWHKFEPYEQKAFFDYLSKLYDHQMYYDTDERELFEAPVKKFYSYIEIIANLKNPAEATKMNMTGRLRVNLQYDKETKPEKVENFKKQATEMCKKYIANTDHPETPNLDINVRICKQVNHPVGDLTVKNVLDEKHVVNLYPETKEEAKDQVVVEKKVATAIYLWDVEIDEPGEYVEAE